MRFLIVSLLLSIAEVTFSANDDDGNTIVDRSVRMSILAEADAAKGTTEEPSSDSDGDSDEEGTAQPLSDSDDDSSSDSDGEGTAEPSSDSDEEGTTKPSSDSDEESSSDSDKEDAGIKECPCGCPRNFVSPPICMRYWIDSRDHGIIARARNKCVYNCYKCQADRLGFKITPVKPVSTKKCPENTDKGKKLMWCLFKPKCFGGLTGVVRGFSGAHPVSMKREKGGKCFKVPNNCVRDCISKAYKGAYVNC